jgi:TonB family protein
MKLCSSLLISAMFHAAVLFLPLAGVEPRPQELIPVVVMGIAEGDGSTLLGGGGGAESQGSRAPQQRTVKKERVKDEAVAPAGAGVDMLIASARMTVETQAVLEAVSDVGIVVADASGNGTGETSMSSASASGQAAGSEFSMGGAGPGGSGSGIGAGGTGNGLGLAGDGHGGGGLGVTPIYAGVSYAHTPKPAYPEQARKGGWEGTVTLGVLVNVGGKAEKIEIKGSSGYAPLDQAAVEALKRWLFRPARYGERAVESWVKIPVVFRLAEVKD